MPRDFKTFSKENHKILEDNKEQAQNYQTILDKYKNMDSSELMSSLFSEASKLKQQGKLDNTQLNSLSNTLAPFLNPEQKDMLGNIINAINEQK